ncbi:YidC/Oxa1 family membrane protein insertase [Candidatus Saccharibacteria bacterium]|nr:YidC/Oxa1 family membrane protein insertase [Candidatus Saccharibacteria bacterium]
MIDTIIIRPITNILFLIYNLVGDFGIAIILFVILVKLCMYPLTRSQLRQTKLMRKIQPELAQIKKNCNGNRQLESLQTMDLYKKYNVKPFRSILTLLIQLPMFIAIFGAIRIMVTPPTVEKNLDSRAYSFVKTDGSNISSVISLQNAYLESTAEDKTYDFHPTLLGLVNLEVTPGFKSKSAVAMLALSILAAFSQYLLSRQQRPSGKSKSKSFRQLMKEAGEGKELDQAEINDMSMAQMSYMMPVILLLIMINLPGALVLYYFLSNVITYVQQSLVLKSAEAEMETLGDKAILKELKQFTNLKEGEVIENKKSGTKITRISAKSTKKKRR